MQIDTEFLDNNWFHWADHIELLTWKETPKYYPVIIKLICISMRYSMHITAINQARRKNPNKHRIQTLMERPVPMSSEQRLNVINIYKEHVILENK